MVQRVAWARVEVAGQVVGQCGPGFLLLVGAHRDDTPEDAARLADRIAGLRVFADDSGKMNLALPDAPPDGAAQVLAVSNFTVYGDAWASRRPGFTASAPYEQGERVFQAFVTALRERGVPTETGVFGADMQVESRNDGPVTLVVDSRRAGPGAPE